MVSVVVLMLAALIAICNWLRLTLPIMVALGNWGLAHRHGERRLRVRAELLRDGGPELVAAMMDELRELHLGVPRPDPDAPRASDQLHAAYETALRDKTSSEAAER